MLLICTLVSALCFTVVEAATQPDVISLGLDRIGSVGAQLSWNDTTSETYVVSHCELPQCNSYVQSPSLTTTSYTLTGLRSLSNYSVFVIATNENGSTDGNRMNFTTLLENALYFMDNSVKRYFASGSIFRGRNSDIAFPVSQFFCKPDSSSDTIEWYTPNGDLIAEGFTSSFYHTINAGTGESTLNLGNYVTTENEGRNFTCRINSSGFIQDHYFGLYYLLPGLITTVNYIGDRIYTKSNPPIVREFVLQRGTFDIDTDELYDIQAIFAVTDNNWMFNPALIQPNPADDSISFLSNVQFNSSAICQLGTSLFQAFFFCISNKPFILRTTPRSGSSGILFSQGSCIENNSTAYVFTIGEGVDIGVTCPLFYNASFLDTSDLIQLDYQLNRNNPRRLWVNSTATFAMVKHDREYVCEDKYGTRASFKARVDASTPIEVFGNDSTITPTSNDTMYIVNEVTLYCLSDSESNGVVWYSDTNANSTLPRTYTPVSDSITAQPHVSNPRSGRSDLVVLSDPTSYLEGYFYCEDSMNRVMFYSIFTQQPVAPIAQINPNSATLQIYIGVDSLNITCGYSNLAHPAPLSYWEGTVTDTTYANRLIATDSGSYTCISSNVVGYTSTTILLNISNPPSPQAIDPPRPDLGDIFITDTFQLSCQFETSFISLLSIRWYHNDTLNTIPTTTNINGNTATSTLTVTDSSLPQAGDYHCVATVGASSPTNSTPISVIINPITLPNPISVTITHLELRTATISWTPSIQFPSLTETYTLGYQRVGDSSYQTINTLNSTSFPLTGLLFNSQYRVYVNATNRFGTTQGFVQVVEAATQPDVISLGLDRIGSVGADLSWNDTTSETYVVSHCELPQCISDVQSPSLTTTSYTLTGLRSLSNYSVFVIATNANGSTDGNRMNFTTLLENALYFMDNSVKRYFASGSIFRGRNSDIAFPVSQFFCEPDSSSDTIEWYTPNGDLIPEGFTSSFYHTITGTGESTLNLGNYVTTENEGRNFTCRINSSGFIQDHYFGLYYLLPGLITTINYIGDRIYTKSNPPIVREFVLQRGSFDIETDELYDIQAIYPPTANNWMFKPALTQPNPADDSISFITNVQFNSSAICQLGTSHFQSFFFCISNKPFILRTTPTANPSGLLFSQGSCIENNSTAYVFTIGEGVDIGVTCPLFYNASFLDTSDLIQLDYQLNRNNPRRLWVNSTATFAMVKHDREYVCEDKYGTRASFKARVDASTPIEVFGNDSTITPTSNDTMYIVNEVTLYCLSGSDSNGVVWYSDTNANSTLPRTHTPVSDSVTAQPHVSNPRSGRSDLVVRSDPTSYLEGYFYCEDSMNRVMFYSIFTQQPVAPMAQINPNSATLQIYIGVDSLNITCGYSNLAHPAPLSYWEGTVTDTTYANRLIATDSGSYTCISSNVVGCTSTTILLNISNPPSPQVIDPPQPEDLGDVFITDTFQLSCQFETSFMSSLSIRWYHNDTPNTTPAVTNINGNTATSTLTVTASSLSQAGDYHCVATVGASSPPTNSTPISVIINPMTLPNPISVTITHLELRTATISWTPSIQFPSLTETYTLGYQRVGDSSYQTINTLNSTSFPLTGLLFNSQYRVYVNATNRFGTTQGFVQVVEAATQPDVISLGLDRIGSVGADLSWNDTTSETYVVSYCELPQCNSYVQSPSLTTTSYTLTGLRSLSDYSVFVIATNANGSTDGNIMNFTTLLENALYFMDNSVKRYFASGSIFRGPNTYIAFAVYQFYCEPDSSSDTIEWYTPNGDLIPEGFTSSFYHTITGTGESTLNLGNYVTTENEGRNFTCRINSSGFIQDHYFGLYYLLPGLVTTSNYIGEHIYTKSNPPIVRKFVLQRGSFDIDTDELYDIQAIFARNDNNWMFNPALIQTNPVDDSISFLTDVQFSSSAICQLGNTLFQSYFFCISNKPFILRSTPRGLID